MGQCWLVLGDTGSVWGGLGWFLVVMGQCRVVLGLICDGTGPGTIWYLVVLGQYGVALVCSW